jgi:hypothetical protein
MALRAHARPLVRRSTSPPTRQKFADARRLRLESERVDPPTDSRGFVSARLLDEIASDRAEQLTTKTIRRRSSTATTKVRATIAATCTS